MYFTNYLTRKKRRRFNPLIGAVMMTSFDACNLQSFNDIDIIIPWINYSR